MSFFARLFRRPPGRPGPVSDPDPLPPLKRAEAGGAEAARISHALVLPDQDFLAWYAAAQAYERAFERVAIVRSPRGNDLNRFFAVSAVEAPNVWLNNNALAHIRRVYPSVVRVDTIRASTPDQLRQMLQARVAANDRFGEKTHDGHINDRFILRWPADAVPARIVRGFDADLGGGRKNEGLDLFAPAGTVVRAAVTGVVATVVRQPTATGYGPYVQVSAPDGAGGAYLVSYVGLDEIRVSVGQTVTAGAALGTSGQPTVKLVVQQPGGGLDGYLLPDVVDPTRMIFWEGLRLQPLGSGLRVRERPGVQFKILQTVGMNDPLETLEIHGRTLLKVGQQDEWINVRTPSGTSGYAAAWFLAATTVQAMQAPITGVNLDYLHALGRPAPSRLGRVGWVRFPYNVSHDPANGTYGNTNLTAAYNRYRPFIEQYVRAGYRVLLVLTHQTYGEGQGYVWPQMTEKSWRELTARFAEMAGVIARQYAGSGLVSGYQIWNEQDAPAEARSSVSMPAGTYAYLLGETIRAIRAADALTPVITGGHTGGPARGAAYARQAVAALPPGLRPDGVACHPYGRGADPGPPYAPFGHIDDEVQAFLSVLPGKRLWITEWGVLDRPDDPPEAVADYAIAMLSHLVRRYPGQIQTATWYAWAQGMDNGYGLVDASDRPRQPLHDRFIRF